MTEEWLDEIADGVAEKVDVDDEDLVFRGKPDVGAKASLDEEQWRDSWIAGCLREVARAVANAAMEADENVAGAHQVLAPENVVRVYVSQYPWRCPFMAVELEECPEHARVTEVTTAYMHTHPGLSGEWDAVRFQVREAR